MHRPASILRSSAARPAAVLVGLLLLAGCSTITIDESTVFLPKPSVTPQTFDVPGVTLHELRLPVSDSVDVNAWHLTRSDAEATVLFYGGNGFYLVQSLGYIRALTDLPVNLLLWDYRGYGRSDGRPSVPALKDDAVTVYDSLTTARGAAPERVIVHGHSLGTFLASYVATEREVGGVVLENPATDVRGWIDSVAPWYLRLFVSFDVTEPLQGESNVERLQQATVPLLVVGGEEDEVTSPNMARTLHRRAASEKKELLIVEGGGHNRLYEEPAYRDAYRRLLERSLAAAPEPADAETAGAAAGR
jgi:hypothetical protein